MSEVTARNVGCSVGQFVSKIYGDMRLLAAASPRFEIARAKQPRCGLWIVLTVKLSSSPVSRHVTGVYASETTVTVPCLHLS